MFSWIAIVCCVRFGVLFDLGFKEPAGYKREDFQMDFSVFVCDLDLNSKILTSQVGMQPEELKGLVALFFSFTQPKSNRVNHRLTVSAKKSCKTSRKELKMRTQLKYIWTNKTERDASQVVISFMHYIMIPISTPVTLRPWRFYTVAKFSLINSTCFFSLQTLWIFSSPSRYMSVYILCHCLERGMSLQYCQRLGHTISVLHLLGIGCEKFVFLETLS